MKIHIMALAAALATTTLGSGPATAQTQPPKLVVMIVVDQMRADYVDRFQADWTGGLKRLVSEGAWFRRAAYPYLSTVTCPGHATVATGAFPRSHGVVQNSWWLRDRGELAACDHDPDARFLGLDGAVRPGASAATLALPTLADELRRQRKGRVVSLSLKFRAAILLGGRPGPDDVLAWVRGDGVIETPTEISPQASRILKAQAMARSPATDSGKTWDRMLPADRYHGPDDGLGEAPVADWRTTFPHALGEAGDAHFAERWAHSPYGDAFLGGLAGGLVQALRLGQEDRTDMLAISFSSSDEVGHAFGPGSQEIQDIYARLDQTIGVLLTRLDTLVGRDGYVVGLTGDHGVIPLPEQLRSSGQSAGRYDQAEIERLLEQAIAAQLGPGEFVSRVADGDVWLAPGVLDRLRARPEALHSAIRSLRALPAVAAVFTSDELAASTSVLSTDPLLRAAALSFEPSRRGDLILALERGWTAYPTCTVHTSANADNQRVPILLFGAGVRQGVHTDLATPADIAPTLAALAGVSLPTAEGRVLLEATAARPVQ